MKIRHLLIAQFLAWVGYTIIDFIDENTFFFQDFELYFVMCFGIPIILAVLYFIKKKSLWNSEKKQPLRKKIIRFVKMIVIWILITVISTIFILILIHNNIWFVRDSYGIILHDIMYLFFALCLLIVSTGLVLVGELFILIVVKSIAYWKHRKSRQAE